MDFHARAAAKSGPWATCWTAGPAQCGVPTPMSRLRRLRIAQGHRLYKRSGHDRAVHSVLGIDPEQSIGKFMGDPPRRYESAKGPAKLEGCIFEIDRDTGKCLRAEGIRLT